MTRKNIVLIGNPNCGKTAMFNILSGSRHKVANYPGVTVEKKTVDITIKNTPLHLIDLPGIYSLRGSSPDELIGRQILLGEIPNEPKPDLILFIADATNLALNLRLALEIQCLGYPMLIAINMADLAKKQGIQIDTRILSEELGLPVVEVSATENIGIESLKTALLQTLTEATQELHHCNWQDPTSEEIRQTHARVTHLLDNAITESTQQHHLTEKLDHIFLHPLWGTLSLLFILFGMFQAVFSWAKALQDYMQDGIDQGIQMLSHILPAGPLTGLLTEGVLAGVGSVVVFLPQILCLYFFIIILEDSGYMARAAFLMDRMMSKLGLNGKAFIPLLSGYACAVPAIMSTRTIENPKDRLLTILITPLTTCSARLPVYTLIIAAFIPARNVFGFINLQGLVMFSLYLAGMLSALGVGYLMRLFVFHNKPALMLMEMPIYRLPSIRNVVIGLWERTQLFLKRAGTIILAVMVLLWFLASYPAAPLHATGPAIAYSFAGHLGHFLQPFFAPLGFNWQMVVALIPGLAAREAAVAGLGTVYAVSASHGDIAQTLAQTLQTQWSLATGLSILAWYVFAPQCISTLAITKRETNSWRWPIVMFTYMFGLAYLGAFVTYHVALWFT